MGSSEKMFLPSHHGADCALRQGEILANVVELQITLSCITDIHADRTYSAKPIIHPFAVIVSQDCDLEQAFNFIFRDKGNERHELPSVLFCRAQHVAEFAKSERYKSLFGGRTFKGNFKNNDVFRYHFIQKIPPELDAHKCGLPELGIDFKRHFSMPAAEVYRRIELDHSQRRSVLQSPYRDHFSQRFFNFNSRVALPEEYEST